MMKTKAIFLSLINLLFTISLVAQDNPQPIGQMMDVGGYKLHYKLTEVNNSTPVVFVCGLGDYSFVWSLVEPTISKTNTTLIFDRAGYAWSEQDIKPRSLQRAVDELYMLVSKLKIKQPFIIVGHSWGGHIARVFTSQHQNLVAGMILIDSSHEDKLEVINGKLLRVRELSAEQLKKEFEEERKADKLKESLDASKPKKEKKESKVPQTRMPTVPEPYNKLPENIQTLWLWARKNRVADISDYLEPGKLVFSTRQNNQPYGDLPLIVLSSGQKLKFEKDWAEYKYRKELNAEKKQQQADLATLSSNSKQIIAKKSGHHIQLDQPELVIKSINEMIEAIKTGAKLTVNRKKN